MREALHELTRFAALFDDPMIWLIILLSFALGFVICWALFLPRLRTL